MNCQLPKEMKADLVVLVNDMKKNLRNSSEVERQAVNLDVGGSNPTPPDDSLKRI